MTAEDFGDYQLHLEFTVPKGSQLGRLQPRALRDPGLRQLRRPEARLPRLRRALRAGHPAARTWPSPRANGSRSTSRIKGKKLSLIWNGKPVYEDNDVRYGETDRAAFERLNQENAGKPEALRVKLREENGKYVGYFGEGGTRSGLDGPDRPGPILLQGDHGPVAYRNHVHSAALIDDCCRWERTGRRIVP